MIISGIFLKTLSASFLACIVTSLGIYTIKKHAKFGKKYMNYFVSFAAGVLISVSFIHLIPESFEMSDGAPLFLSLGFFSFHLLDKILDFYTCGKQRKKTYKLGLITMLGIGFHSFIDGIIYSITFNVSVFTGAVSALGMILHEFPEGIITFVLLVKGGYKKDKASHYSFLSSALSTPLGTLLSFPFINVLDKTSLGTLLSISAGALLYVGATHLLPEAEKEGKRYSILALAAGILVAVLITLTH